jgi:hypothetical protein
MLGLPQPVTWIVQGLVATDRRFGSSNQRYRLVPDYLCLRQPDGGQVGR